ncbi:MAG: toxin-activating lysine-acyltransferase [Campylobacterales bacterium]|nr:toxin-activating lysine-acyltransferase [Campylobacterales bacterium]
MSQEKQEKNLQTMSGVIGEIVWLLLNSPIHKHNFFIGDLEWMVMPPVANGQFRIFKNQSQPVGVILWASVSEEVSLKLEAGRSKLGVNEWNSGENIWLMDVIAPFGKSEEMIQDLKKTVFKDKKFRYFSYNEAGERKVILDRGENV